MASMEGKSVMGVWGRQFSTKEVGNTMQNSETSPFYIPRRTGDLISRVLAGL